MVVRIKFMLGAAFLVWTTFLAAAGSGARPITEQRWLEARTEHFHIYSCGPTQEVARVAGRLEQFRSAYSTLAGTQAVVSPPIIVMAFPDQKSLEPFLPLYGGKPANIAGFFHRGRDENLIALSLSESAGVDALQKIYHEYAHLLLRRNETIWPLWLKEGMADIYSTFEVTSDHSAKIGKPIPIYLELLASKPMIPLPELFQVNAKSPEYNLRENQEIFYAESWLLAHYLMLGGNSSYTARFGTYTVLLTKGETALQGFTNTFHVSAANMLDQLRTYLKRGNFAPLGLAVKTSLLSPKVLHTRPVPTVEVCFRLGDQLLRIGRFDAAQKYFVQAAELAPESPLPYEGQGLLAAERGNSREAVSFMEEAMRQGSKSHLACYIYGREKYRLLAKEHASGGKVESSLADVKRAAEKALTLMADFAPAEYLLGVVLMTQGNRIQEAERHLLRAVELEPENDSYRLTLATLQSSGKDYAAVRRTLQPLWRRSADPGLRKRAEEILRQTR